MTDPVDARLLAALAEAGKVAVHELAATVGMDPRDVAYRLVNLSAHGLPLLVGVESDPASLRSALASASAPNVPTGSAPSPPPPAARPPQAPPRQPPRSRTPPAPSAPQTVHGMPSGPHPVHGSPSGPHPVHGTPSGAHPVHGAPSRPRPAGQGQAHPGPPGPAPAAPGSAATGQAPATSQPVTPASTWSDPGMSRWGPPQSARWARGDPPPERPDQSGTASAPAGRPGTVGDVLDTRGLEGEDLAVQLLEVQDPADFLFTAAGYRLDDGERAVVVHTEVTNRGPVPFASLPDNHLELLTHDGTPIGKAPVSLTSRPPHRIGIGPGETSGGHTVYVVGENIRVVSVRWSPRPEPDERSLTWTIGD